MKFKEISSDIAEILEKKNRDYGNSFDKTIIEYGMMAYFLRIEDKMNRLKNLTKDNSIRYIDESVEDTLKDIAGYTILMLNFLNND